jgi:hypothetical protein
MPPAHLVITSTLAIAPHPFGKASRALKPQVRPKREKAQPPGKKPAEWKQAQSCFALEDPSIVEFDSMAKKGVTLRGAMHVDWSSRPQNTWLFLDKSSRNLREKWNIKPHIPRLESEAHSNPKSAQTEPPQATSTAMEDPNQTRFLYYSHYFCQFISCRFL